MKLTNLYHTILEKIGNSSNGIKVVSSIAAIIAGLIFGLIVMLVANPGDALTGFVTIISGGFNNGLEGMGDTLRRSAPIVLTGLSVAFAFRTGLFNIGATGQLTVGAFAAVYVAYHAAFLGPVHWVAAVLAGLIGGAIWGAIPGLLKAYRNVHEVVASIMLNYIAMYLVKMLILTSGLLDSSRNQTYKPQESARLPTMFLDKLFPDSNINISILIAILAGIVIHIILNKTTFGYELKSVGFNRSAARYAGMNEKRNIVLSMTIAGALAGLAGAVMFLVGGKGMTPEIELFQEGFTGIAIALLGLSAPIGVFLSALFYGSIQEGGSYLQPAFQPEIIDILIAVILYFAALSLFMQRFVANYISKQIEKDIEIAEGSETS